MRIRTVCVYCGSSPGLLPDYIRAASRFGAMLAERGLTLEEILEAFTWTQLGIHQKPCALLDVARFYSGLLDLLRKLAEQRFLRAEHLGGLFVDTDGAVLLERLESYRHVAIDKWMDGP
mgnify:CR=1 FL=1